MLTKIDDFGDRWIACGRHENEVKAGILRRGEGVAGGHDSPLRAGVINDAEITILQKAPVDFGGRLLTDRTTETSRYIW